MSDIKKENELLICEKCGGWVFEQVAFFVYKTKLNNPSMLDDNYVPVQSFRCADCKHVPDEYNILKSRETKKSANKIIES